MVRHEVYCLRLTGQHHADWEEEEEVRGPDGLHRPPLLDQVCPAGGPGGHEVLPAGHTLLRHSQACTTNWPSRK